MSSIELVVFRFLRRLFGVSLALCVVMVTSAAAQSRALNLPLETQWTSPRADAAPPPTANTAVQNTAPSAPSVPPGMSTPKNVEPVAASANPPSNQDRLAVGVGDQIFITVFGQPDMSAEVSVNESEQVTLPLIGTLKVAQLSPAALEKLIAQRLKDGEYLRNPEVSVQVRQVRSQMVSVLGEVQRPGRFPILGKLTVLDALATAGGLTQRADRTVFLLRRATSKGEQSERQEIPIRLDQVMDASRGELDLELRNDDVVFVAQQKLFYVHGEVRRPGAYPMEPDLNVMRVLSISGGVTERGSMRRIRVNRMGPDQKNREFSPDLNTPIVSGDVIYVDERLF